MKEATEICHLIKHQKAHIYVCGDVQMAENVYQTLRWAEKDFTQNASALRILNHYAKWKIFLLCRKIIAISEKQSEALADKYMLQLRVMHLASNKPNLNL